MSEAFDILKAEIAAHNDQNGTGGIAKVAKILGYARSTVSVAINGHYVGSTDSFEKRVLEVFKGRIECPFAGATITRDECKAQRKIAMPTHDAAALKDWQTAQQMCRSCPNNPQIQETTS